MVGGGQVLVQAKVKLATRLSVLGKKEPGSGIWAKHTFISVDMLNSSTSCPLCPHVTCNL